MHGKTEKRKNLDMSSKKFFEAKFDKGIKAIVCGNCGAKIASTLNDCVGPSGMVEIGGCIKQCECPQCGEKNCCKRNNPKRDLEPGLNF
ncbi:hypothetical protein A3757_02785 [Oleiphilus sp. HI0117]|nr:hypothetical protein A3732_18275 [Oleiphilus sp. HI0050]KZZ35200.1 hypothetical protein A3757_02785 [Oleiphilus sp. HI0117]KZZ57453.1 hypothetical protein A3761_00545 [Oleiphilus sp. HI0123]